MKRIGKIQPSEIRWETPKLREIFYELENKDPILFKQINAALDEIEKNAFCCILLPKKLIPKKWRSHPNVWKYDLPGGWRLFYSVSSANNPGEILVLSIVLDRMSHKEYEILFKY